MHARNTTEGRKGIPKADRERSIFRRFVQSAGLPVPLASIESRTPPEADILCEITGHGTIAFELVTIDGRNYCKGRSVYEATARALANACPTHSPQHAALGRKFGNVAMIAFFRHNASLRERKAHFPPLISLLLNNVPAPVRPGSSFFPPDPLRKTIERVHVSESPTFALLANGIVTALSANTLHNLRRKLKSTYPRSHPVELLAHTQMQPWSVNVGVETQIFDLIRERQPASAFRRVWVFDVHGTEPALKFGYPEPPFKLEPWPSPWFL